MAALNPLVYWHQIFGANDLVFVAMLLAAVLAARGSRPLAAGALVGLACATKQLAWPFAPFLLLALSGARSFRELLDAASWRRLLAPVAAAAGVFLLVVAPVAALDPRAFWGDIVVYNVGLPGGDNYPIGGTPGFGAANFLIYFGRVTDLREYFPFSVFYLLLVPLGLLLLRAQLRDAHPEWALATGSTALVASIYFSRVVHPNYLIPAAVCLPLAVLARKRGADIALVPLLLLALAVEVADGALFRAAWEQAAARGPLGSRLGPAGGARAARARGAHEGPARAAGERHRRGPGRRVPGCSRSRVSAAACASRSPLLAAALVVLVPVLFLAGLGTRTGVVRAQSPAVVQAAADASRLLQGQSPYTPPPATAPRGREAVSASFRLDPPAELLPTAPLVPAGPAVLAALARLVGVRDLRLLAVLALAGPRRRSRDLLRGAAAPGRGGAGLAARAARARHGPGRSHRAQPRGARRGLGGARAGRRHAGGSPGRSRGGTRPSSRCSSRRSWRCRTDRGRALRRVLAAGRGGLRCCWWRRSRSWTSASFARRERRRRQRPGRALVSSICSRIAGPRARPLRSGRSRRSSRSPASSGCSGGRGRGSRVPASRA